MSSCNDFLMVESDDEFTELCSKLLKRVKKSKPLERQVVSKSSTAAKKKSKTVSNRNQAENGSTKAPNQNVITVDTRAEPLLQSEKCDSVGAQRDCEPEPCPVYLSNRPKESSGSDAAGKQGDGRRSPDQPSTTELVLERMQQFKRVDPVRMRLSTEEGCHLEALEEDALSRDSAVAQSLEMDRIAQQNSLEDAGLFFCQLCQKDLTAMSTALREQHVNRCLDQEESLDGGLEHPQVPSCPLCGKPFNTEKSRASHLKRCAAKLEVPAQTLLQAVQRQAAESGSEGPIRVPPVRAKRKASTKQKEPTKKRKVTPPGTEVEDMLVAMALSRSLQEDTPTPSCGPMQSALPTKQLPAPEKKGRRKQKAGPPPLLLIQVPEVAIQRIQDRVALLLSEEPEASSIIALPPSRFWDKENREKAAWCRPSRIGKISALWEISNMIEMIDPLNYYTEELSPPIIPWKPPQTLLSSQTVTTLLPAETLPCAGLGGEKETVRTSENGQQLSNSQRDRQALLDLAELAGEGMTFTQWKIGSRPTMDRADRESLGSVTASGFVPSYQEEISKSSTHSQPTAPLVVLAANFQEMVNNPHLSDAQLQTDCGEVLNVHMFVLYARCPLLVEAVHTEGFWVDESSTGRVRRLLLNDVSAEAAMCFLRFLYCAHSDIPVHCLPHVCELARRFAVGSLIDTCEHLLHEPLISAPKDAEEDEEDDGGERAETFQELLKSMWVNEDEEIVTEGDAEGLEEEEERMEVEAVGEGELKEIYEFAATQRRVIEENDTEGGSSSENENEHHGIDAGDSPAGTTTQHPAAQQGHQPVKTISPVSQVVTFSPLETSACSSPATRKSPFTASSSISLPTVLSSPTHSALITSSSKRSAILPSSSSHSVCPDASVSQLFIAPQQSLSATSLEKCPTAPRLSAAQSTTPISHSMEDDAVQDLFTQHSPIILDDSFDRMFSETCGEYVEPPSVSEPGTSVTTNHISNQEDVLSNSPPLPTLFQIGISPNFKTDIKNCASVVHPSQSSMDLQVTAGFASAPTFSVKNTDNPHAASTLGHSFPTSSPCTTTRRNTDEQEVILVLSSDEEIEPNSQVSSLSRNGLENIAEILGIKESPMSFCERQSSEGHSRLEMSSSTETSWLVPATPLLTKMPYTSQLHISTLPQAASSFSCQTSSHKSPVNPTQVNSFVSPPLLSPRSPEKSLMSKMSPNTNITTVPEQVFEVPHSTSSKISSVHSLLTTSPASSSVFEVGDSEDEVPPEAGQPDTSSHSFQMDYEPPIHMEDDLWFNGEETPKRPCLSPVTSTPSPHMDTPDKGSGSQGSRIPLRRVSLQSGRKEKAHDPTPSHSSNLSILNPQLWDEWEDEEEEMPALLSLSERLSKAPDMKKQLRTPVSIVRRRELAPKVPITPLPDYSDMDTPILKKELNRFGVRALPKRQMVLKLKEIFSYTHQTMSSGSEEDVPSSHLQQGDNRSTAPKSPVARKQSSKTRKNVLAVTQGQRSQKPASVCATGICALEGDTGGDQPLTASQESSVSSIPASDTSLSQSSTANEFETAFADEDEDEVIAPSQLAGREAATSEAVKRFIEEHPALHQRILLYQPLELGAVQSELKQAGIKMAAGKLLDFLDSRCVTFTTAAARKEKKTRGRRKAGKRF